MSTTTSGIQGLDAQMGGGIPTGTTVLLVSEPGNAIGAFSEQFAGGGLNADEDVHFFEFDRPVAGLRERILGFHHNGSQPKVDVCIYDGYATQFGTRGGGTGQEQPLKREGAPSRMLQELQRAGPDRPYRVVVESLSSLLDRNDPAEVLEFVRHLVYLTREVQGTALLTMVKGLHDRAFETQVQHLVSGVFEMGIEKKGFGLYSYLLVKKLLDVPDPVRLLLFKETDKGLWLESTKRVF